MYSERFFYSERKNLGFVRGRFLSSESIHGGVGKRMQEFKETTDKLLIREKNTEFYFEYK